ncbi:hypothetical protein GN244_ATG01259 [Phytophthora infestans]|uniref:Secreted RxLR effector peptide protein n=1 Tax=Phytophthora infestans TaxID=4787 RepID=A0A833TNJ9_PHYIN|nr:hypothetical protein GN244_ATG01259 [Phytophthora infestans]KAF4144734.1 hypothetical protein GN958_ATG06071 [Phytophthora infestans]
MPSLTAILSSLGLALLVAPISQAEPTGKWFEANPTDLDTSLLSSALKDLNIYSPDITNFICSRSVEALYKKLPADGTTTKYNFVVNGCIVRSKYAGQCSDVFFYPECGNFDVLITSGPRNKPLEVRSIKVHKVKAKTTKE